MVKNNVVQYLLLLASIALICMVASCAAGAAEPGDEVPPPPLIAGAGGFATPPVDGPPTPPVPQPTPPVVPTPQATQAAAIPAPLPPIVLQGAAVAGRDRSVILGAINGGLVRVEDATSHLMRGRCIQPRATGGFSTPPAMARGLVPTSYSQTLVHVGSQTTTTSSVQHFYQPYAGAAGQPMSAAPREPMASPQEQPRGFGWFRR